MQSHINHIIYHLDRLGIAAEVAKTVLDLIQLHAKPALSPVYTDTGRPVSAELGQVAKHLHRTSLRRGEVLGQPVADPDWNMLIALIADIGEDRSSSITSLCYASGVPMTTALRHLHRLEAAGLVTRHDHPWDARGSIIDATPRTITLMTDLILSFCIEPPAQ